MAPLIPDMENKIAARPRKSMSEWFNCFQRFQGRRSEEGAIWAFEDDQEESFVNHFLVFLVYTKYVNFNHVLLAGGILNIFEWLVL